MFVSQKTAQRSKGRIAWLLIPISYTTVTGVAECVKANAPDGLVGYPKRALLPKTVAKGQGNGRPLVDNIAICSTVYDIIMI